MTKLISALLLVGSFAFAPSAALAAGEKTGFIPNTQTSQGGSGNPCTAGSPGCTTTTSPTNPAGNNPQPSTCTGPAGQCK
jgi:hypothetical protein